MSAKRLTPERSFDYAYSICTLVTEHTEYQEMVASFHAAGFGEADCEYLFADNTASNEFDGYRGINRFLGEARGRYVIVCHQDILLTDDRRDQLEKCISGLDRLDPQWGILSNAGGMNLKYTARHVNQGPERRQELLLPLRAISVDENFMVLKGDANLALSADLEGFHFYGTDICLLADIRGYSAYVIDFRLTHKSAGTSDDRFYRDKRAFIKKYHHALRDRFIATTITRLFISGSRSAQHLLSTAPFMFMARQYDKFLRKKERYRP